MEQYRAQNPESSASSTTPFKTQEPEVESEYVWGDGNTQIQQVTQVVLSKSQKSQKNSIQSKFTSSSWNYSTIKASWTYLCWISWFPKCW